MEPPIPRTPRSPPPPPPSNNLFEFVSRMALMSGSFLGASVVGAASASLRVLVGLDRRGANDDAAKALEQLVRFSFGQVLDVQIEGRDFLGPKSDRPAVFVCNHQNILDILLLAHVFPRHCCIMAKDAFFYVPFMGQFLYLADNIFIDRANAKSAAKTMQFVAAEMKRKKVGIFMYPEGTRSYQSDNSLLPFKQGAFRLAIEGQVPIVPIVISTYHDVCNPSKRIFKGGKIRIKILPPIPTIGKTQADVSSLLNETRNLMLSTLQEISDPPPKLQIKSKL